MNILLFADVDAQADHSAVEGLFRTDPQNNIHCIKVFFSKNLTLPRYQSDRITLPYHHRRRGLIAALNNLLDLHRFDIIVIRNLFHVLAQVQRSGLPACIGFWESFPHSHRRLEQAYVEKRAVLRKRLEYLLAARRERSLIQNCAFYLPITEMHKSTFYPDLKVPYLPTPMGFDFSRYPVKTPLPKKGPIQFVYIGAVDELRRLDIINQAFLDQQKPFRLDYYSASQNKVVDSIRRIDDSRIRFHDSLPRSELFKQIASADVGVCFFPHTKTYITASPTKTVEYGALGLSVLVNPMPAYEDLIDESCAFICEFAKEAIQKQIEVILSMDRNGISERAKRLQKRIFNHRNYENMARYLFDFFRHLVGSSTGQAAR